MKRKQFLASTLAASITGAQAQTMKNDTPSPTKLIPREILFGNPEKAAPTLSPDGKKLAYLAPVNGVRNVWVQTIGKSDAKAVTTEKKRDLSSFFWQADSAHILYQQDSDGDENIHVFQASVASSTTRDLTPVRGARAQIVALDYAKHPDEMLVSVNARNPQLFDVQRLNLKSGELKLEVENPGNVLDWTADNDLKVRVATAMLPGAISEIQTRDGEGGSFKGIQKWGPDETFGGALGFSPDNKQLWLLSSVGAETSRLLSVDMASQKETVVAADARYDVSGIMTHPKTNALLAVSFEKARTEWQFFDKAVESDFRLLEKQLGPGDVSITSRDLEDKTWIVVHSSADKPAHYYSFERASKKATFLYAARPALQQYQLAKMEPVSFAARDGLKIEGYLTMPVGVEKNAPTVLLVHGGPWARDSYGYSGLVQLLANRGYAVLQVNFRGSTGYGKSFVNAGDREWAAKMHEDLLDAKKWAVAKGYSDPKRFAIAGGSYGGYATLVGLTFTPEEFTCGVDIVGPSNLVTLLKSVPPYWAPMLAMMEKRMGSLSKDEDFLRARSPLFKADRITKPLLIGQGANDPRVKQAESDQIVKAMRDNKKAVQYIVFADEGHGFVRPANSLRFFAAMEHFLAQHLGGRSEPVNPKDDWKSFEK